MPDDPVLIALLYEEEGPALDFKRDQYKFVGATDTAKAEILKDILAFTNSWRRNDAFILIGVDELPGGKAKVVGVLDHLKDADLQQFVNSKTDAPVDFSYSPVELEGKSIGVIRLPVQQRPRCLLKPYGGLLADVVYVRRGSSTVLAKPAEISQMGAATVPAAEIPNLSIEFADGVNRRRLGMNAVINVVLFDLGDPEALPDYEESADPLFPLMRTVNRGYLRELAVYTVTNHVCKPFQFVVVNGSAVAHDVRIELSTPAEQVILLDDESWPELPQRNWNMYASISNSVNAQFKDEVEIVAKCLDDRWIVDITVEKVQPHASAWVKGFLYIGRRETGDIVLAGTVSADNLPKPQPVSLAVHVSAEVKSIDQKGLLHIEWERYLASPKGQEWKKMIEKRKREKGNG